MKDSLALESSKGDAQIAPFPDISREKGGECCPKNPESTERHFVQLSSELNSTFLFLTCQMPFSLACFRNPHKDVPFFPPKQSWGLFMRVGHFVKVERWGASYVRCDFYTGKYGRFFRSDMTGLWGQFGLFRFESQILLIPGTGVWVNSGSRFLSLKIWRSYSPLLRKYGFESHFFHHTSWLA